MASVFISYAREDQAFVRTLHDGLARHGHDVWVDWAGIPPSADYFQQIERAMDAADAVVVVLSPELAESRVCGQELAHALAAQKKLIPVLRRGTRSATVHEALRRLNWISFREEDDQEAALATVVAAVETDLEWVSLHTRLLVRAREWEARGGDRSLLLHGRPLREAEEWLASSEAGRDLQPTGEQRRYLLASRRAATGRQRRVIGASVAAALVSIVLAVVALLQREEAITQEGIAVEQRQEAVAQRQVAEEQRHEAEEQRSAAETQRAEADLQRREAERQEALARSRELAAKAVSALVDDPELSIRLAVEALAIAPTEEAETALRQALGASHVRTVLTGHGDIVARALFSSDGARVVTVGFDGTVRAWAEDGAPAWVSERVDARLNEMALSPDGTVIATAADDGVVRLWAAADGALLAELAGHTGIVYSVAFTPDGAAVASAGEDGTVRLWDVAAGAPLATSPAQGAAQNHVVVSPDGERVASAGADGTAHLFSVETGELERSLVPEEREPEQYEGQWSLNHVRFTPDGERLLTSSYDGSVRVWDVESGEVGAVMLNPFVGTNLRSLVIDVVVSPDGARLATASSDGVVRVWDAATGARESDLRGLLDLATQVSFSADGRRLAASSFDGTARVWDVATGAATAQLAGHTDYVVTVGFDPSGQRVVTAAQDGTARVWEADTGAVAVELGEPELLGLTAGPTGEGGAAVLDLFGASQVWETVGGGGPDSGATYDPGEFAAWSVAVVSPDGRWVAAADLVTLGVHVWDVRTGEQVALLEGHEDVVRSIAWSPDGRTLATAGIDAVVRVWDVETGMARHAVEAPVAQQAVAVSPDGRTVAAGGDDAVVRRWDVASGELMGEDPLPSPTIIWALAYSADGAHIAAGGGDNVVWLMDAASGAMTGELRGHTNIVATVAFSPDGAQVFSGDWSGEVRVWDREAGQTLAVYHGHQGIVVAIAPSADGQSLLTLSTAGPARVSACDVCGPVPRLLEIAEARGTRELSTGERRRYLGEPLAAPASPSPGTPGAATPVAEPPAPGTPVIGAPPAGVPASPAASLASPEATPLP